MHLAPAPTASADQQLPSLAGTLLRDLPLQQRAHF